MMGEKIPRSLKVDSDLDKKMIEFAKIHYDGNVSRLIITAIERFLQENTEKAASVPEELINSIVFSNLLLINGQKDEATWNLLLEEARRECKIINPQLVSCAG